MTWRSIGKRPTTSVRNHYPNGLNSLTASLHAFAYEGCGEPLINEASEHLGLEPMNDYEQTVGGAVRVFGEQF